VLFVFLRKTGIKPPCTLPSASPFKKGGISQRLCALLNPLIPPFLKGQVVAGNSTFFKGGAAIAAGVLEIPHSNECCPFKKGQL
jgi:hypothetical protein